MKTKTLKQILATTVLTSTLLITSAGISNAALQSNPNTQYKKGDYPENWISNFRKMEEVGGVMGLSETLNTDLTPSSKSNNIDIHMVKTTEYGAVAILSASGYGNPSNANKITTSTGNNTGMILNTNQEEWTAGGLKGKIFSRKDSRYFNSYDAATQEIPYPGKVGDALGTASTTNPGCVDWHGATDKTWVNLNYPYFRRGLGGIFSYFTFDNRAARYSRGVVVVGEGL